MPQELLLAIGGTFLLAGFVKGVTGLGLPTVSLALLTAALGLPQAMALLIMPSLVTNVWQAFAGGQMIATAQRIWPFLVMASATVWLGAMALTRVDVSLLSALLGLLLIAYGLINLGGIRIAVPHTREAWLGPAFGAANGVLTGMTGSFVVPGVMFLQSIGLPRDALVQAMGMLFTLSTVALALALGGNGLLTAELGFLSLAACVPAIAGMVIGQRVRHRMSEQRFRRVLFLSLLVMGLWIVWSELG
jgi:uncharacterized protein